MKLEPKPEIKQSPSNGEGEDQVKKDNSKEDVSSPVEEAEENFSETSKSDKDEAQSEDSNESKETI